MSGAHLELKDKFGNVMRFGIGGDNWYPPFPLIQDHRQHITEVRHLELRPDDVLMEGFPKTGSHWHHEILHMLLAGSAEYILKLEYKEFLDFFPEKELLPSDRPRVLFTHFRYNHLPLQVWEKKVKVVYLTRSPKDTWVSFYNHFHGSAGFSNYDGTWNHFLEVMMDTGFYYGDWFDYVLDWEARLAADKELNYIISSFEDLKLDPVGQIQNLDKFLGLNRGRELCERIAEACKFSNMKAVKDAQTPSEMERKIWKQNAPGFYRKGEVGDWKNWFTVAQNEAFDEMYEKRIAGSQLTYRYQ
ncbi:sulfotransferase 1C3-like [Pomacea canaliculata]|uniref:sulfotransferase 1C3-like n=1 Tax=Pomacea canaliculata TaxID=400727 RepID=UPI000D73DF42|nr:sulfotransferase 1C3-like [Pomacea canaliculata]XP_025090131.1 sulfotransferase 1C3-like [Pomacea canaliculata]